MIIINIISILEYLKIRILFWIKIKKNRLLYSTIGKLALQKTRVIKN